MNELVHDFSFPTSALLAVAFLLTAFGFHFYAGGSSVVRTLRSLRAALVLLAVGAVMLAIEGTWAVPLHRSPLFVAYVLMLMLSLALTVFHGIERKAKAGFLLNHTGLLLILWAALFGAPDVSRSKLVVGFGQPENVTYGADGLLVPLPFTAQLMNFRIDYYADGQSPRQYTSLLIVDGKTMTVAVNEPARHDGYTFFQESYDREAERYSVLLVVRDPWLPFVYGGMLMLALGAVMLLFDKWKVRLVVPVTLVLTVLFTAFSVSKINFGTLMPALRSWWFVPHLFIYMVAYSLMALALAMWLLGAWRQRADWQQVSHRLVRSSSALLIIGMLTGSVWARQAWGDYWAWDPKENWAAATWFLSLMHLHLHDRRGWRAIAVLVLAFLALQITWYGVNYLPSAMQSMHTYNNPK